MKKNLPSLAIATIFFLSIASPLKAAEKYKFDSAHTNITWSANHFGFSSPSGKFVSSDGFVVLDEANPQNSSVKITIKTNSIQTGNIQFDSSLKSENFLNTIKYPEAKFVSTNIIAQGKKARITGDFTLLGVTQSIVLDAKLNKIGINPVTQKKTAGFSAQTSIKRSDFGMDFGVPGISDLIKIAIEAEAILDNSTTQAATDGASNNSNLSADAKKTQTTSNANLSADTKRTQTTSNANKPWILYQQGSKIEFTATQGASNISGSFSKFDGQIVFDPNKLETSKVTIDINTSSVSTSVADAISTLQNADWLYYTRFPHATFTSQQFAKTGEKTYIAKGKLTLKGKTLPIDLNFSLDSYSDANATVTGYTTIKRSDFNIGDKDITKANGVKDEVKVKFTIAAYKAQQ